MKAQRGCRYTTLSFFNLGARWGWVVKPRSARLNPGEKNTAPIAREDRSAPWLSKHLQQISPPTGLNSRTVQPVASLYTEWAIVVVDDGTPISTSMQSGLTTENRMPVSTVYTHGQSCISPAVFAATLPVRDVTGVNKHSTRKEVHKKQYACNGSRNTSLSPNDYMNTRKLQKNSHSNSNEDSWLVWVPLRDNGSFLLNHGIKKLDI
jgi:hypothetical protein